MTYRRPRRARNRQTPVFEMAALHQYALWAFIRATGLLLLSVHTGAPWPGTTPRLTI